MRRFLLVGAAAVAFAGCGSDTESGAPTATADRSALDRRDTRSVERQVDRQLADRLQSAAVEEGTFVDSSTTCTKQSDTAYKCVSRFTSPPATPPVLTEVTCDRSGGNCITESRPEG